MPFVNFVPFASLHRRDSFGAKSARQPCAARAASKGRVVLARAVWQPCLLDQCFVMSCVSGPVHFLFVSRVQSRFPFGDAVVVMCYSVPSFRLATLQVLSGWPCRCQAVQ